MQVTIRNTTKTNMYVCICNALKDKQLTAAARGAACAADVFKKCGKRPQCGKCVPDVENLVERDRHDLKIDAIAAQ